MYPRNFAASVPAAGFTNSTKDEQDSAAACLTSSDEFEGPAVQASFRNQRFGPPGLPLHVPGVNDPPPPNISFGVSTGESNYSTKDCLTMEPTLVSKPYIRFLDSQEANYARSKDKVGQVPDHGIIIPESLRKTGFGVSTRFSESAASVIQNTKQSIPRDPAFRPGYQKNRDYRWGRINPVTHTFGVTGSVQPDHLNGLFHNIGSQRIVPVAVDRAIHNTYLPDPSVLDPQPGLFAHTLRADQARPHPDPSDLPPAGVSTKNSEFSIGDTISEMGCMDAFDADYDAKVKPPSNIPDIVFGVPTKPNPFPNPLKGAGRYSNLGLSDEDFLKLRDKEHIINIMEKALALSEEESNKIFDSVAQRCGRNEISCAEFHQEYKKMQL